MVAIRRPCRTFACTTAENFAGHGLDDDCVLIDMVVGRQTLPRYERVLCPSLPRRPPTQRVLVCTRRSVVPGGRSKIWQAGVSLQPVAWSARAGAFKNVAKRCRLNHTNNRANTRRRLPSPNRPMPRGRKTDGCRAPCTCLGHMRPYTHAQHLLRFPPCFR